LQFMSNQIDTTTGSVELKAIFDNKDDALYPNQFVNARLQIGTLENATVIPSAALQLSSDGDFVYVVKQDGTVVRQAVKAGPNYGDDQIAVLSGVTPGQQVVTTGIDRLNDGTKVQVVSADSIAAAAAGTKKTDKTGVDKATTGKDSGPK
jgi:multidrug efflux system membrane fusion protein